MFETFKNAWKIIDIKKKLLFTLMIIVLFRLGSAIPVPFIDSAKLSNAFSDSSVSGSMLGYFNFLSGETFSKATLFALSISPYITSSIVMQLLGIAIPALERLQKSGPEGQEKIQKITRMVTIILAVVMAYGYYAYLNSKDYLYSNGFFECIVIIVSLTAGACLIMWMGERIDEKGIGNGISMILFAGIVSRIPAMMLMAFDYIRAGEYIYILYTLIAILVLLATIVLVVHITNAERRLPVQYAKRQVGRRVYGGSNTFLPLKLNMTGVMPIIFGQSIVSMPATLALVFQSWDDPITTWFSPNSKYPFYAIAYLIMIIAFAYFYVSISFNPMEVASNIQKNGGTIAGHRPGRATAEYIQKILNRVTLIGAIFLSFIAIFPMIVIMVRLWTGSAMSSILSQLAFGGSSILIVVSVALDTTRDLEAQITMRHYKGFL